MSAPEHVRLSIALAVEQLQRGGEHAAGDARDLLACWERIHGGTAPETTSAVATASPRPPCTLLKRSNRRARGDR